MGSVRQRKDDGRWFIQWIDGAGKQRQKTLNASTPAAADRKGHRLLASAVTENRPSMVTSKPANGKRLRR